MTLYVDYRGQKLVVSKTSTTRLGTGSLHENDVVPLVIVILEATGNEGDPYTVVGLPEGFDTIALGARDAENIPAGLLFSVAGFDEVDTGDGLQYEALLALTADEIHDLFPDDDLTDTTHPLLLDIQFSASDGLRRETVVKQWPFNLERDIYDADETATPVRTALITVPYCRHDITALLGDVPGCLDQIPTAFGAAPTNLTLMLFIAGSGVQVWRLEASDASPEDGELVVDPDDFDLEDNNRKWKRRS